MVYVLIVSGIIFGTQEFATREQCEAAAEFVKASTRNLITNRGERQVFVGCFERKVKND